MTRRKFFEKLFKAGSVIVVGGFLKLWRPAKKAVRRKFVWAGKVKKYPGSIRLGGLRDVEKKGKWSG